MWLRVPMCCSLLLFHFLQLAAGVASAVTGSRPPQPNMIYYLRNILSLVILLLVLRESRADDCLPPQISEPEDNLQGVVPLCVTFPPPDGSAPLISTIKGRTLTDNDLDMYKIDLRGLHVDEAGASLSVEFEPHNVYAPDVDHILRIRGTQYPTRDKYAHQGVFRIQLSPMELRPLEYYVSVENVLSGTVDYTIHFVLDTPTEMFAGETVRTPGGPRHGARVQYFFVNLTESGVVPARIDVELAEADDALENMCTDLAGAHAVYKCYLNFFSNLVDQYYGTELPVCKAHEALELDIVGDCRMLARFVGLEAYSAVDDNLAEAYTMCVDEMCLDGCKHGVMESWTRLHFGDDDFAVQLASVCSSFGMQNDRDCIQGVGAGVMATGRFDLRRALETCEELSEEATTALTLRQEWQRHCFKGVFRHYMDERSLEMTETEFRSEFADFCNPRDAGTDESFLLECHIAQGECAAFRADENFTRAEAYCELLFDSPAAVHSGRTTCIKSVRDYQRMANTAHQKRIPCPRHRLHTTVNYNLPADFIEGTVSSSEWARELHIDWLEAHAFSLYTFTDVHVEYAQRLWWFAIDPNHARTPYAVTVYNEGDALPYGSPSDRFATEWTWSPAETLGLVGLALLCLQALVFWCKRPSADELDALSAATPVSTGKRVAFQLSEQEV